MGDMISLLSIWKEKLMDNYFLELSHEDNAAIFPDHEKFVLGMRLYKIIQNYQDVPTTQELLADLSDQFSDDRSLSTNSGHKQSLSYETSQNVGRPLRHVLQPYLSSHLILNGALKKDAFYTGPQRNKLIQEALLDIVGNNLGLLLLTTKKILP